MHISQHFQKISMHMGFNCIWLNNIKISDLYLWNWGGNIDFIKSYFIYYYRKKRSNFTEMVLFIKYTFHDIFKKFQRRWIWAMVAYNIPKLQICSFKNEIMVVSLLRHTFSWILSRFSQKRSNFTEMVLFIKCTFHDIFKKFQRRWMWAIVAYNISKLQICSFKYEVVVVFSLKHTFSWILSQFSRKWSNFTKMFLFTKSTFFNIFKKFKHSIMWTVLEYNILKFQMFIFKNKGMTVFFVDTLFHSINMFR